MSLLPVALYGLEVPPGDLIVPALPDTPATFRITMAAIDPSEPAEFETEDGASSVPRATLKLIRQPMGLLDDEDEDEDDEDDEYMRSILGASDSSDDDEEDEDDDDEPNGGPSDPAKSKKARKAAALKELLESLDNDSDEDEEMDDAPNGVAKADKKGKAKATDDDEEDEESEDDEDEDDDEELELQEFVICTLDPEKNCQQTLDITIGEDERVFFKVSGTHTIYLTGNYVVPNEDDEDDYSDEDDSEEEYDLSPDEDELLDLEDDESDDLDGLVDPRVIEVDEEEDIEVDVAPKLVSKADKKGKNKRAAEELEDIGENLDDLIRNASKGEAAPDAEPKLSKKQLKKMKNNKGDAVPTKSEEAKKDESSKEAKSDKKVQFAKNLEQGPTGPAANGETKGKTTLGVKTVKGVKIDDKKLGSGPGAKKGDRVAMRYIGKLTDGKVFDSNKKGKPFSFKLGAGEVISGWDIGVVGLQPGGERRLTIPANLAYGSKSMPGIPANSTLVFDIKLLEIK